MKIHFSHKAVKFLDKIKENERERIRLKIKSLLISIEETGLIPFRELDIKKLRGSWQDFYRMKAGKMRVIFRIDREADIIFVYDINFRGDIY